MWGVPTRIGLKVIRRNRKVRSGTRCAIVHEYQTIPGDSGNNG